ncbi:MAG: LIC12162 family protein [Bacteroidia bacterium]|nr:LIC12162 family protein [Bacteroidia bacterium]
MNRFLITTALEETWKSDRPVLFLGEWCKLYNRKAVWENLDSEMMPYHWNDRKKLFNDYKYLQELYEELILELTEKLNKIHNVNHSIRYWRILIGPWLGYFVQMLFDRWSMIDLAIQRFEINGVNILQTTPQQYIPNDMDQFPLLFANDIWNESIYGQLLKSFTDISIEEVPYKNLKNSDSLVTTSKYIANGMTFRKQLQNGLIKTSAWISQKIVSDNEALIISSYLPTQQDFLLQLKLGQFPKHWHSTQTPQEIPNPSLRKWTLSDKNSTKFDEISRKMIPANIPTSYLEGYKKLSEQCKNLKWPKNPSFCFTSNSHIGSDIFKAWAATKVEEGMPLVIGQHGGGYGISKFVVNEDHEIKISDKYLTWGWDKIRDLNVQPTFNMKNPTLVRKKKSVGKDLLLVTVVYPRQSYKLSAEPISSQWLSYFEDQCRFTAALPSKLRYSLLVRLYSQDLGWNQKERWNDRFPNVRLDNGETSMSSLLKHSRLYISSYNATTFLESLSLNIPTIIFWNPEYWELRDEAIPYFNRLKEVGIFHETPESAAAKVAAIWDDVPSWWNQPNIQEVRDCFCNRFARTVKNPVELLKNILTTTKSLHQNN